VPEQLGNIEIVRLIFSAMEANDPDSALELLDDDIDWHPAEDEPETKTLHGKEAVVGLLLEWSTAFDDFHPQALEFIDGGDCAVVPLKITGRMRGSGAEIAIEETNVFWIRDGKVVEVREYRTRPEALAAAEITPEGGGE
jgi:ketosteroid isomerase-like protein